MELNGPPTGKPRRAGCSCRDTPIQLYASSHLRLAPTISAVPALDPSQEGVVVTSLSPGGLVAKGKRVKAGDSMHAVNGVKVTSVEHATELLQQAEGIVQLVITRANALPKGWSEKNEAGATFWLHAASGHKSYTHPAAIRHNADDTPITLGDRFRGAGAAGQRCPPPPAAPTLSAPPSARHPQRATLSAPPSPRYPYRATLSAPPSPPACPSPRAVKKLQMIQSLARAGEEDEDVEGPEASEPAFVQVQRTTRI